VLYYASIAKPFFAPPPWVFGLAWGIIYPLIAVAFIYLLYLFFTKRVPSFLVWLFVLNGVANLAFTPLQLGLQSPFLATLDIYLILITLIIFQYKIISYSKTIFILLVPYLLWGAFATILQSVIVFIN
jgi:tryptophan-rich sensory protein